MSFCDELHKSQPSVCISRCLVETCRRSLQKADEGGDCGRDRRQHRLLAQATSIKARSTQSAMRPRSSGLFLSSRRIAVVPDEGHNVVVDVLGFGKTCDNRSYHDDAFSPYNRIYLPMAEIAIVYSGMSPVNSQSVPLKEGDYTLTTGTTRQVVPVYV